METVARLEARRTNNRQLTITYGFWILVYDLYFCRGKQLGWPNSRGECPMLADLRTR
jgi:hypothetical protein